MKRSPGPRKTPSVLSDSIHQQLNMYALAASAAGVSALCLAQPSEAKIIYTHAHIRMLPSSAFALDLNHDKIPDVGFSNTFFATDFMSHADLVVGGYGNQVLVANFCAAGLPAGKNIGPHGHFGKTIYAYEMGYFLSTFFPRKPNLTTRCPWADQKTHYLGVKFHIKGKVHFGWVRVKVSFVSFQGMTASLTGYAYETIVGKAIKAGQTKEAADDPANEDFGPNASLSSPIPDKPQPVSLGMLALGAQGVPLWRRKENESVLQSN
jgi:hypothetical protein